MTKLLVVMALPEEGGSDAPFPVVYTGCGKVNATLNLSRAIQAYQPEWVINFGSAGGVTVPQGSWVNVTRFLQHDMDATPLGFDPFATPFEDGPVILEVENRLEGIWGDGKTCATGDRFMESSEGARWDVVDMEAYALAKTCAAFGIPFSCVKYISDGSNENSSADWASEAGRGWAGFLEGMKSFL